MTIADDDKNPKHPQKLAKSLDAIAALRIAMEKRLTETLNAPKAAPQPEPKPAPVAAPVPAPAPTTVSSLTAKIVGAAPKFIREPAVEPEVKPEVKPEPKPKAETKTETKTESRKEAPEAASTMNANFYDPSEWSRIMFRIADCSQKLVQEYMDRNKGKGLSIPALDPAHLAEAFSELSNRILNDPERFVNAQISLWQGYAKIWQVALDRMQGKAAEPVVKPAPSDKRFQDKEWQANWLFDYIKQSYLLTAQWVHGYVHHEADKLDPKQARKLEFYTRQMVDAISPSNFWMTNPQVLRATFESHGENLIKGLENLLGDLERGGGKLRISMSNPQAFKVGEDLATTPGKVVYQNHLMQLIQYEPQTESVFKTPVMIMPPWINKYYILDLREKNSYIGYLVKQGYTVFCVSWVNPDKTLANVNFDDYMADGSLTAMREVRRATGEDNINIVGYCIGGTLLASTLAYLNAAPNPPQDLPKVTSATYLVTMTDFSEPGDLGVFIDTDQVKVIEEKMATQGYLDATSMAMTFNLLRANDLIWSFVVNNYLLGKEPFPFDILYWNADSTNLPAAMHSYYLRQMYIDNKLVVPNGLKMKDVALDLHSINTPSFLLSTREDHIAPWRSTYAATQIYKGPIKFVLSGSGHIAGIVNPPVAEKYGYWTNDKLPKQPEEWLAGAAEHKGSWWPEWLKWLEPYSGGKIPARAVDKSIEAAPGSYVKVKVF